MRVAMLAIAALALPVPALAQDRYDDSHRVAEELGNPAVQAQVAAATEAMTGVLLDLPVGPLMRAAATLGGEDPAYIDPDARVGDVVGPAVAQAPREIAARVPQMMGAVAEMSGALADMLPRLAEIGERARQAIPRTR